MKRKRQAGEDGNVYKSADRWYYKTADGQDSKPYESREKAREGRRRAQAERAGQHAVESTGDPALSSPPVPPTSTE